MRPSEARTRVRDERGFRWGSWACEWSLVEPAGNGDSGGATGCDTLLPGLAGTSVAERFRAWTGVSGRRYVFSVFSLDEGASLPSDGGAVVIAVDRQPDGKRVPLWIDDTGSYPQDFFRSERIGRLAATGRCELHLHLLAIDAAERQAVLIDLRGGLVVAPSGSGRPSIA